MYVTQLPFLDCIAVKKWIAISSTYEMAIWVKEHKKACNFGARGWGNFSVYSAAPSPIYHYYCYSLFSQSQRAYPPLRIALQLACMNGAVCWCITDEMMMQVIGTRSNRVGFQIILLNLWCDVIFRWVQASICLQGRRGIFRDRVCYSWRMWSTSILINWWHKNILAY